MLRCVVLFIANSVVTDNFAFGFGFGVCLSCVLCWLLGWLLISFVLGVLLIVVVFYWLLGFGCFVAFSWRLLTFVGFV